MSLAERVLLAAAAVLPAAVALRMLYAPCNHKRDPTTPEWRIVTRQFGRELRTEAMTEERALRLASRLIFEAVKVVRLNNDAAGTSMTLAEIRAKMEQNARDA